MGPPASAGLPAAARTAAAHVLVADIDDPAISDGDAHHLLDVLRLRPGEPVSVGDGAGRWRPCRLSAGATLAADGPVVEVAAPWPPVTVAFAAPKGDRGDWAVQKLTEVGVDVIIPLVTDRGVVRWDAARAAKVGDRWRTIGRQAAMQSRRARLPEILAPQRPVDLVGGAGPGPGVASVGAAGAGAAGSGRGPGAALADPAGGPLDLGLPTVLIGPEGGWSDAELAMGAPTVRLGPTVLRTETAAVVVAALLVAAREAAGSGLGPAGAP